MSHFIRKTNRLAQPSYRGPRLYFVTICAENRKGAFDRPDLIAQLLAVLQKQCKTHLFDVYAYCFMPDHMHLLLVGLSERSELQGLIRAFKGESAAVARECGVRNLWQKGFYDHVVRSGKNLGDVASYIFDNPVRAGLVKQFTEWPYSGSWMFDWNKLKEAAKPYVPPWKVDKTIEGKMAG